MRATAPTLARIVADGHELLVTHGNGPQVGALLRQSELAAREIPPRPLPVLGAETEGQIGYLIQSELTAALHRLRVPRTVATVICRVEVNPRDPAFRAPTKPVGRVLHRGRGAVAPQVRKLGHDVRWGPRRLATASPVPPAGPLARGRAGTPPSENRLGQPVGPGPDGRGRDPCSASRARRVRRGRCRHRQRPHREPSGSRVGLGHARYRDRRSRGGGRVPQALGAVVGHVLDRGAGGASTTRGAWRGEHGSQGRGRSRVPSSRRSAPRHHRHSFLGPLPPGGSGYAGHSVGGRSSGRPLARTFETPLPYCSARFGRSTNEVGRPASAAARRSAALGGSPARGGGKAAAAAPTRRSRYGARSVRPMAFPILYGPGPCGGLEIGQVLDRAPSSVIL